jgi:N-acetylmuramoyl-L-alanine amidase
MESSQRGGRWGVLLLLAALPLVPAHARTHHTEAWARDHFATAERMREALNGRPPADRARRDYQRVLNAYRNVYFGAPASTKADPSVVAVAETLVEMGRRFDDDKILHAAIAQYTFLRREYPGSKYRCDALFTIGEIYKDDLNDPAEARGVFQEFLHRYPHNRLVEDARQAVAELDRDAAAEKKAEAQKKPGKENTDKSKATSGSPGHDSAGRDSPGLTADSHTDSKADSKTESKTDAKADSKPEATGQESSEAQAGRLPRVTGIRHWSTPDYTRVAIDLESDIKFGSQRIANPDRIFFDLRGTKLASTLVGKSFDVDDGFLKKIRVAQFQPGRTRVVLEVDNLSDYEAFLLPNPYRLIIDIHGKDIHGKDIHGKDTLGTMARARELKDADIATADVEALPKAGSQPELLKPAVANAKTAPVVKKVIVEADDDDATDVAPAKAAKSDTKKSDAEKSDTKTSDTKKPATPVEHSHALVTASRKAESVTDSDDAASDEQVASDPPPTASASVRDKPLPRLDSSRKLADVEIHEARPTASGDRSLIRALGLKIGRIVIDPGHGGHDTGTIGPDGLQEKDLVLEVGRRLGKLLETRLGAEVVYTRKDDTFIPLETRTAIANQQRADLFISIHANSSHDAGARGVETYYLNFTSSPEALEVAARENAVSEKSIYELQDLVKKIALKEKIEESREFAGDVQESLHSGLAAKSPAIRNRGVKKAPFIVLIGANMPSILAEISFVSNPADEHRLETSEYRQRIAESLYRGIAKYVDGLSGVKVASKLDKAAGQ